MNTNQLKIVAYKPEYAHYFEKYNKAWLEEFFFVEPVDKYVLENCKEAIIDKQGKIIFAAYKGQIIGTAALMIIEQGVVELTKMAVSKEYRNIGAGTLLCTAAIAEAGKMGADKVILYSNTRLSSAIAIYRKLGFIEIPVGMGTYKRADIKMELSLKEQLTREEIKALIEEFGKTPEKITDCLYAIPKDIWDWQPPYNKWTIRQNIVHLADSEASSYIRCRRFIAEPGSPVLAFDQDKWAASLLYEQQDISDALALYRQLRKTTYNLIRQIPNETWNNTIYHAVYGKMIMWQWLRYYTNHTHTYQMKRVYNAWMQQGSLQKNYL